MKKDKTIGAYLIEQLYAHGVKDIFGIPGDYVLGLYDMLEKSPIRVINTSDEQGAGFAADAYARIKGIGAVCITYCVGGLKIANTTAQAFAEKSPVIVISGSPGISERVKNPLLHHKVRDFDTQKKIFQELTVAAAVMDNPHTAMGEIDRVIHAVERHKLPGYIEIPRDMVNQKIDPCWEHIDAPEESDAAALAEALEESVALINGSRQPVVLAGVEIQRFGLEKQLMDFAEKFKIPVAATIMGKSVIPENKPYYIGVYEGALGHDRVCSYVESSDCLIMMGALLTDFNLGLFSAHLDPGKTICANKNRLGIKHHLYDEIYLKDFLGALVGSPIKSRSLAGIPTVAKAAAFTPVKGKKVTMKGLFDKINAILAPSMVLLPEIGESFFGSVDLVLEDDIQLIASAYYCSLGFSVPGSLGVQIADPARRPLVLVGDGAFQMTGMELSSIVRYGLSPIVVVLNNFGYGTERPMMNGPYNDLLPWNFGRMTDLLGGGKSFTVNTEDELESAFAGALEYRKSFTLIDVHLDVEDRTPVMTRLTERMAQKIRKEPAAARS